MHFGFDLITRKLDVDNRVMQVISSATRQGTTPTLAPRRPDRGQFRPQLRGRRRALGATRRRVHGGLGFAPGPTGRGACAFSGGGEVRDPSCRESVRPASPSASNKELMISSMPRLSDQGIFNKEGC